MKKKFSVQLSEQAAAQLAQLAEHDGLSKAAIVRQALAQFLQGDGTRGEEGSASQRDNALDDRLERIEQGLKTLNEVTALHARYFLAMTPHLGQTQQREACQRGQERFEVFAQQVRERVNRDAPLIEETISRIRAKEEAIAEIPTKVAAVLGLAVEGAGEVSPASNIRNEEPSLSAAAQEGGSRGNFRDEPRAAA
jgi:predicted transcriptional regulator